MKKSLRKYLSRERRDVWDSSKIYEFCHLSVDRLKHKLRHIPKRDTQIKGRLEEALEYRTKKRVK